MSLWWVQKDQLDQDQLDLIENLPLREDFLILGPPGSGKTNVLLRRAQFVRGQGMPNVLVLTFTRSLTEFVKTGCFDPQGREIFPQTCVSTIETWLRSLYRAHQQELPADTDDLVEWKQKLATGAMEFPARRRMPKYDAIFVDEAQDLVEEEVELLRNWSEVLFFVGDNRQRIFSETDGLDAVRKVVGTSHERTLQFHYRVASEICRVADRILLPGNGKSLESTCHYDGPKPATVRFQSKALSPERQLAAATEVLKKQIRVYADRIKQGDRLGVIVARKEDRDHVLDYFDQDPDLRDQAQVVRAKDKQERGYDPAFASDKPICILTLKGCKGLEFRVIHWLFSDDLSQHHRREHYYTVVTRAKTSLDVYYTNALPQELATAHSSDRIAPW